MDVGVQTNTYSSSTAAGRQQFSSRDEVIAASIGQDSCKADDKGKKSASLSQMRNQSARRPNIYGSAPAVVEPNAKPGELGPRGRTGSDWAAMNNAARRALVSKENRNLPQPVKTTRGGRQQGLRAQDEIEQIRKQLQQEAQMDVLDQQRVIRY